MILLMRSGRPATEVADESRRCWLPSLHSRGTGRRAKEIRLRLEDASWLAAGDLKKIYEGRRLKRASPHLFPFPEMVSSRRLHSLQAPHRSADRARPGLPPSLSWGHRRGGGKKGKTRDACVLCAIRDIIHATRRRAELRWCCRPRIPEGAGGPMRVIDRV